MMIRKPVQVQDDDDEEEDTEEEDKEKDDAEDQQGEMRQSCGYSTDIPVP